MSSITKRTDSWLLFFSAVFIAITIWLKVYLNHYCYSKIIQPKLSFLPVMSVGHLWAVVFAISILCYSFKPTEDKTPEKSFEHSLRRLLEILFAWLMAYLVVEFLVK